ncbi:hypothetical protein TEA_016035 [Camellia sinensis var. sinensis]|uniref:Uncharacterized protein n=1 Tax=Camellia sinensis var. sinensis TaxID=542762 RepID=A0A4S4F174_CAMSN|nr:hypothetical protein TEA_016035 [Camellia sinensis var. sinensis]
MIVVFLVVSWTQLKLLAFVPSENSVISSLLVLSIYYRNYKPSLRDQYCTLHCTPVAFYYSTPASIGAGESEEMVGLISERLKVSLSETLTHFYLLAGRLRDNLLVDRNDDGVDFVEARVINNFHLSNFLDRPKLKVIDHLAPPEPTDYYKTPLLLVQVNLFPCNRVVVTVKMSHKIADGFSVGIFMKGWSDNALGSPDAIVPDFNATSSCFPPRDDIPIISLTFKNITQKVVKKRSRFGRSPRPYALVGGASMRSRFVPPMPKYSFGNIVGMLWAMLDNDDHDYESQATHLANLVCQLRKGSQESNDDNKTTEIASLRQVNRDDMEMYAHSSWCRFLMYETDFGWGKLTWVSPTDEGAPVGIALVDARDGEGVEIWVNLFEEDMALFEADQELLAYASPNPSALLNN